MIEDITYEVTDENTLVVTERKDIVAEFNKEELIAQKEALLREMVEREDKVVEIDRHLNKLAEFAT